MKLKKGEYFSALSEGKLDMKPVEDLLAGLKSHLTVEDVPPELLRQTKSQARITEELTRLPVYVARGLKSWGGLVIPFPGSTQQLTTEIVGTPYLRRILYPILDLHRRIIDHYRERLPCIYLLGIRFPDVFLRKFRLLASVTPHVIVITSDLLNKAKSLKAEKESEVLPKLPDKVNEAWVQAWLCREMMEKPNGLKVPAENGDVQLCYLGREFPASEGTTQPERLDILGFDKADHSLAVFEIKGPAASRVDLENLFLQGLEHQKWLELNKMAVKFAIEGPRGRHINTKKRVRLILGFFQEEVPDLFWELRHQALRYDRYLKIDFVHFAHSGGVNGKLVLTRASRKPLPKL
jgi:hypothetical protein